MSVLAMSVTTLACESTVLTGTDAERAFVVNREHVTARVPPALVFVDDEPLAPGQRLDDIEPSSIARIEVVKGADALERYGDAGQNGVIRIYLKPDAQR